MGKTSFKKSPKHQQGQATVELVVLGFVLVPLFIIVPLLGKYMDFAQTTTVASRYVAFEGAVHHSSSATGWKTDEQLAAEVRRRFYSRNDLSIKTNDVVSETPAERNPLWVDHRGNALLPTFDNVTVQTRRETLSQPLGAMYADEFDLPQDNLYTGIVNVNVANIAGVEPFDAINLSMNRSTTLLVDPWASNSSKEVEKKVQDAGPLVFPYQLLEPFAAIIELGILLFEGFFGDTSPPEIGRVDPDVVPSDRVLKAY